MKEERMYEGQSVTANIHSKKGTDEPTAVVTILSHTDNNNVVAVYNGQKCTAVYNPFVSMYYVDDAYGKICDAGSLSEGLPDGNTAKRGTE